MKFLIFMRQFLVYFFKLILYFLNLIENHLTFKAVPFAIKVYLNSKDNLIIK